MESMDLIEVYDSLVKWGQSLNCLAIRDRNRWDHLLTQLDSAITVTKRTVDVSSLRLALEAVCKFNGMRDHHLKPEHLPTLYDFFTGDQIAILFGTTAPNISNKKQMLKKKAKTPSFSEIVTPEEVEFVKSMAEDDFNKEMDLYARIKALKILKDSSVNQATIELIKQVLIIARERKFEQVSKMWNLLRRILAWFTGDFLPAFTRKVAYVLGTSHERIQVIASEVLDEKYTTLLREFKEMKFETKVPIEDIIKKAKRRGKLKETRKVEEKEEKFLKIAETTAGIGQNEDN
jgi:hypothetical protein